MAASMLPASGGRRPPRGALLTVSLGRSESAEWVSDADFRESVISDVTKRARERGRVFFEVYGDDGRRLHVGEVAS